MTEADTQKRRAAERAVDYVESGMRLGLGTGSTARHVLDVLSERLRDGSLRDVVGVATSRVTEEYAAAVGIPLGSLDEEPHLDLTIDGADEVDPRLDLIKGLGGALLWEKIVACASDRVVIVADASKRVRRLGEKAPLPVEVVPFGWRTHLSFLRDLGCEPSVRQIPSGAPFMTDGGHLILDCRFDGGIPDPRALEASLNERPGIVDSGLFLGIATMAVIAGPDDAVTLMREVVS
ncbi:MAG: ribose-5-phosphate isomerase RpiA [Longimicrobiales bacterium]